MSAMQYHISLPADYDMAIIKRRITDKGHLLDGYSGLHFKAYLYSGGEQAKSYAPFYLWRCSEALSRFVTGSGFASLEAAFGRPRIDTWQPLATHIGPQLTAANYAVKKVQLVAPDQALAELLQQQLDWQDSHADALASISAFNPQNWTLMQLQLLRDKPNVVSAGESVFHCSYVALGA
ncbi:DUF4865 family protein [Gallaecimonas mangrovi]|uniref:DUF4865 family protein n=1 Tax=Gallaecimonas mangrovi TaxID=2291597 RepID=UPI000E203B2D|nr:DUF4865 family protein [Gallaecimonas mangrovi]